MLPCVILYITRQPFAVDGGHSAEFCGFLVCHTLPHYSSVLCTVGKHSGFLFLSFPFKWRPGSQREQEVILTYIVVFIGLLGTISCCAVSRCASDARVFPLSCSSENGLLWQCILRNACRCCTAVWTLWSTALLTVTTAMTSWKPSSLSTLTVQGWRDSLRALRAQRWSMQWWKTPLRLWASTLKNITLNQSSALLQNMNSPDMFTWKLDKQN